VVKSEDII